MGMAKVESLPCSFGSETIMKTNLVQYLQMLCLDRRIWVCYCWVRGGYDSVSSKEGMLRHGAPTLHFNCRPEHLTWAGLDNDEFDRRK